MRENGAVDRPGGHEIRQTIGAQHERAVAFERRLDEIDERVVVRAVLR